MNEVIDFIQEYQTLIIAVGVVVIAAILFFTTRWLLGRSMRRKVYLCIDFYIRNSHEQSFYTPTHKEFSEYAPLCKKLNRHKADFYIIRAKFIFVQYQPLASPFTARPFPHLVVFNTM